MMTTTSLEGEAFPKVEAGDAEEVVLALETGRALWGQGDPREAVRWLRRAAEHAEESGNDLRALSLARVAADLTTLLQSPQALSARAQPTLHDEFADQTEMSAGPPRVSSLPPKLPTPPLKPTASRRPPAPSTLAKSSPSAAPKPTPSAPAAAPRPAHGNGSPHTSAAPAPTASRPAAPTRSTATTAQSPVLQHSRAKRRGAVRVAVSSGEGSALSVEILDEGQSVPAGAIEALLVPLDPGADLLNVR